MSSIRRSVPYRPATLLLTLLAAAPLLAQQPTTPRTWEHEVSDLTVDPRIHFGQLANGLRYAWMKNGEPKDRCYVRLHVDVGAFAEEDDQDGMAHFLEHMAFNGSENFPAGTLVEWFQERGMAFGPDLNASTNHTQTIYNLDLPYEGEKSLREGFQVVRDWAGGLLLEQGEIEKEKGVIDGEDAAGDTAQKRIWERIIDEQYSGTRFALRDVIGEKDVREAFTAEAVRAFYERWYRPDRMTLAIVGDLGELDPTTLIEEHFADLPVPETAARPEPETGDPELERRFFCVFEDELPNVQVQFERLVRYEEEPDTKATRIDDVDLGCARRMLNLRFQELVKKEGTPFLSASVGEAGGLEVYDGEVLSVTAETEEWEEAFAAAEYELRRALVHGFDESELEEVRANWLRSIEEAVEREPTRHSRAFLFAILSAVENRFVPTNAEARRELMRPVIDSLTVEECHEALVEAWGEGVVNLFAAGNLDLGAEAGAVLEAAYDRAREREVEKREDQTIEAFAYASDPEQVGRIVEKSRVEDLDAWLYRFENGVHLNVKTTDFKEREILVHARVGEGLLTLAPEDYAVGWVGTQAYSLAGLGAHTTDDLRRLLSGKRASVGLGMTNEAFTLGGATTEEDLLLQLELLCAYLTDSGWRDDGIRLLSDRVPLMFEQLEHVVSGPLLLEFLPALFHGDQRFGELPAREAIEAVEMDDVRAWLEPCLAEGPIEVTIVGDLDVEAVKAAAERTLGLLPVRRARNPHDERRKVAPPESGLRMERSIETEDDKSLTLLVFPTADGMQTRRRRELGFLGKVVQDRLRVRAREELGAAYSPGARANPSRTFPGVGLLMMQASAEPEKVATLVEAFYTVATDLRTKGVTEEEVKRLAEPELAQLKDRKRTNGYWIGALSEAQSRPESLDDVRSLTSFYEGIDPERMGALAKDFLDPERASLLVVNPRAAAEEAAGEVREASTGGEEER